MSISTREELKNIIDKYGTFILLFTASWWGPCKKAGPFIKGCASMLKKDINLFTIDVDKGSDISSYLRIRSVPSIFFFYNQKRQYFISSSKEKEITQFFKKIQLVL